MCGATAQTQALLQGKQAVCHWATVSAPTCPCTITRSGSLNYRVCQGDDVPIGTAGTSQVPVLTQLSIFTHIVLYNITHLRKNALLYFYHNYFHFRDKETKVLTLTVIAEFVKTWAEI